MVACDGKRSATANAEEAALYDLLRRSSSTNLQEAAEATWELRHPKLVNKNDPDEKAKYIQGYIKHWTETKSFGKQHCDRPSFLYKPNPRYDGNYVHIEGDSMCGSTPMRTIVQTYERVEGKWYFVRYEVKTTYIDPKAAPLKASP